MHFFLHDHTSVRQCALHDIHATLRRREHLAGKGIVFHRHHFRVVVGQSFFHAGRVCRLCPFGCALTICSFSPSEIRVSDRRAGTARKERSHTRHAGIKMSRNPLHIYPFDGTRGTPGAETRPTGKPVGGFRRQNDTGNVSGKKFQRERKTPPRPPQKRFCTGIFSSEPRKRNSKPRKKNSGARNFAFRPRNFASDRPKK